MEENKAIWIIGFDDKKKNYITWASKLKSAATLRGYSMILVEKEPKIPKHNKILKDTDTDREKEKLRKANEKTYYELILACQGPIAFNIVRKLYYRRSTYRERLPSMEQIERKI